MCVGAYECCINALKAEPSSNPRASMIDPLYNAGTYTCQYLHVSVRTYDLTYMWPCVHMSVCISFISFDSFCLCHVSDLSCSLDCFHSPIAPLFLRIPSFIQLLLSKNVYSSLLRYFLPSLIPSLPPSHPTYLSPSLPLTLPPLYRVYRNGQWRVWCDNRSTQRRHSVTTSNI